MERVARRISSDCNSVRKISSNSRFQKNDKNTENDSWNRLQENLKNKYSSFSFPNCV